jgi:alkylation response protein AidB-like acyl-CoA dehydrogenase
MPTYKAPLRDMRFVLNELLGGIDTTMAGFEDFTPDLIDPVLEEAAKVCEEVLFPINRSGDEEGCTFENGVVRTPKGFKEAYDTFREGGWTSIACEPEYGGQGMPKIISSMVEEMICAANLSFSLYPGLTHGAHVAMASHASEELKATYLPKMVDGTWSGTMCLTEAHCGTDLGLLRTKAEPQPDGTYKVTGSKIFISSGEHDLTENIIHLVLARLPDAPKGVKGISLFLVPKFLVKADGSVGARNGVACGAIEHKMGIKASATCVINFDAAEGYLVGEPNKGMRAMFAMMNTERVGVGAQGLGVAEASYQGAVMYARERLQARALTGAKHPDKPADPIIVHPDVRRMLLTQRAYVEGSRALSAWVAQNIDIEKHHPDAKERQRASDFVALMTPVVKAFLTDLASEVANIGVQVYGGHGYIREWGMEQYVRDARITQIYEGTNGIQSLDLVGRKMPAHAGRYMRGFFHTVDDFLSSTAGNKELAEFTEPLAKSFGRLQQATIAIAQKSLANPDEAGAAATEYLRLFGLTALAYLWARMAAVSLGKMGGEEDAFYRAKVNTARFYMQRLLPQTGALLSSIMAGSKSLMSFEEAAF